MHRAVTMAVVTLVGGCTRPPVSLDDEASESGGESTTSESTTSESSEASMDDELGVVGFIPLDQPPGPRDCNIILQDCPDGEKCIAYSLSGGAWDANKCVPVTGDQQAGELCHWGGITEGTDDCDASSMCWNVMEVDRELIGTCVSFCTGTPDAPECPPAHSCILASDGPLAFCLHLCDPLVQDCAEGLGCYWVYAEFNCIFTADGIPTGEPCGYINDCTAGSFCADATSLPDCAGSACCTSFCNLALGDAECAALPGTTCVSFFERGMGPPGYEDVGLCLAR